MHATSYMNTLTPTPHSDGQKKDGQRTPDNGQRHALAPAAMLTMMPEVCRLAKRQLQSGAGW